MTIQVLLTLEKPHNVTSTEKIPNHTIQIDCQNVPLVMDYWSMGKFNIWY